MAQPLPRRALSWEMIAPPPDAGKSREEYAASATATGVLRQNSIPPTLAAFRNRPCSASESDFYYIVKSFWTT